MSDTLFDFPGGLYLDDHKAASVNIPVQQVALPEILRLPLHQHTGSTAQPVVKPGDKVLKGQIIAEAQDLISAHIHAPTSGYVTEIAKHAVPHPSCLHAPCIVLATDGADQWSAELPEPIPAYRHTDPEVLRLRLRWAGVVGLGGAVFPTCVKTRAADSGEINTLIINAAECEPYITCDDMIMREQAADILDGVDILQYIIKAEQVLIGIEDNKPEAIAALQAERDKRQSDDIKLVTIPAKYPSGGEKQLIQLLTGKQTPSGGRPSDIGVLCQNVATCTAIADAILRGHPLINRIVTLTGEGITQPGNYHVPMGMSVRELINQTGGYKSEAYRLVMGGPMMGFSLPDDDVPITKGSNCFIVASPDEMPAPQPAQPCIRCGECAKVCPALLLPQQLYWHAQARDLEKVQAYHLFDCIECGCCAHVCPSHIPLVQYYRYAKTEIRMAKQEKVKSEIARQRFDSRTARLQRLAAERKARLRKRKEELNAKSPDNDAKKAAIAAAMQRVNARKKLQNTNT